MDSDKCKADILIVTTQNLDAFQNEGYNSVVNTLTKFSVPANKLSIDPNGVDTTYIRNVLYRNNDEGRYKAIVFPNGRVSYNSGGDQWVSAIRPDQWLLFDEYSAVTGSRIVYLNEYPSNNTATELAYDFKGDQASNFKIAQKISFPEDSSSFIEDLKDIELNTQDTWHFPAKIEDESKYKVDGFDSVEPLLYFESAGETIPEKTIAAVACERQGSIYAGFFTSFGSWSKTAAALNIYWLTWALNTDFSKISDAHISTEKALDMSSDAPKSIKLALLSLVVSTLLVIFVTF
ncbi:hypothetical protein BCR36DRAFT_287885 [Piromyces finnis]|uniref:Agd3 CBM87 domain-containing protein n=1 Tax=Piromyces finnis TaxID=1754191 RepID=A0A1Y1VAS4_9FUNG|nr:hypothetical protein BCR36DRAFT_287885 [Piromyces finnis]|eukprot:ORX51385.1 hypothetical protein BCR36DRAFT_287885 [Piromyces finnis]